MPPLFPNHNRDDALQSRAVIDFTTMWLFGLVSYHEISSAWQPCDIITAKEPHSEIVGDVAKVLKRLNKRSQCSKISPHLCQMCQIPFPDAMPRVL